MDEIERLTAQRDRMRAALIGLVGVGSADELRQMEAILRITHAPKEDKAAMINAIHVLLESDVIAESQAPVCICGGDPHVSHCPACPAPFLRGLL